MTEQERILVVSKINEKKDYLSSLEEKQQRKEKLEQCKEVKEYLELIKEIIKINKYEVSFGSLENLILNEFINAFTFNGIIKNECDHEILIYDGSYGMLNNNSNNGYNHFYLGKDETCKKFHHNNYVCLECAKTFLIENWENFEKEKIILKNNLDLNAESYIDLYYKLLYNHSVSDARQLVIDEFNKKKIKRK